MLNNQNDEQTQKDSWKTRIYMVGAGIGAALGFISAYLYAREAESYATEDDERPDVPPTAMLGLVLSIVTLIRKIAETPGNNRRKR